MICMDVNELCQVPFCEVLPLMDGSREGGQHVMAGDACRGGSLCAKVM